VRPARLQLDGDGARRHGHRDDLRVACSSVAPAEEPWFLKRRMYLKRVSRIRSVIAPSRRGDADELRQRLVGEVQIVFRRLHDHLVRADAVHPSYGRPPGVGLPSMARAG